MRQYVSGHVHETSFVWIKIQFCDQLSGPTPFYELSDRRNLVRAYSSRGRPARYVTDFNRAVVDRGDGEDLIVMAVVCGNRGERPLLILAVPLADDLGQVVLLRSEDFFGVLFKRLH